MNLLALETSSTVGSVALSAGGEIREYLIATPREQTAVILPLIDSALSDAKIELADLDGIVFGRGPGSFTGLRVAAAIAQGLALSVSRPVLSVSSLAALAQRAWRERSLDHTLVCVDARMGEVYWAELEIVDGLAVARGDERIGAPGEARAPAGSWAAIGTGFVAHAAALAGLMQRAEQVIGDLEPRATDLIPQALADFANDRFVDPQHALPSYLRDESAWKRH